MELLESQVCVLLYHLDSLRDVSCQQLFLAACEPSKEGGAVRSESCLGPGGQRSWSERACASDIWNIMLLVLLLSMTREHGSPPSVRERQ